MNPKKVLECNYCPYWTALKKLMIASEWAANAKNEKFKYKKLEFGPVYLN